MSVVGVLDSDKRLDLLRNYLTGVSRSYYKQEGVEFTNRTEFHNLMSYIMNDLVSGLEIVQEVRVREYGRKRPDFIVRDRIHNKVMGCLETKRLNQKLSDKRFENQIEYYSRELPVIFTNYIHFQLIVSGEVIFEIDNIFLTGNMDDVYEDLKKMLELFLVYSKVR